MKSLILTKHLEINRIANGFIARSSDADIVFYKTLRELVEANICESIDHADSEFKQGCVMPNKFSFKIDISEIK